MTEKTDASAQFDLNSVFQREVNSILVPDAAPDEASTIHSVRVAAKKIRAFLHLLKGSLGGTEFEDANILFRDAGRSLRRFRDNEIIDETLSDLRGRGAAELSDADFEKLRRNLTSGSMTADCNKVLAKLRNDVHAERISLSLAAHPINWGQIANAIARSYRRNANAFENAVRRPSSTNLHEWRKQTKRLQYQMAALAPILPPEATIVEEAADNIGELLGKYHDLTVLKKRLKDINPINGTTVKSLGAIIRKRQRKLRKRAVKLGHGFCSTANRSTMQTVESALCAFGDRQAARHSRQRSNRQSAILPSSVIVQ